MSVYYVSGTRLQARGMEIIRQVPWLEKPAL